MKHLIFAFAILTPMRCIAQNPDTVLITIVLENAEEKDDGSITLHPAPGYRENWFYWNGAWWSQKETFNNPKIDALCVLQYFDDGDHNALWLTNIRLPDKRFLRIADLLAPDTTLLTNCCSIQIDANGIETLSSMSFNANDKGDYSQGQRIHIETCKPKILKAILNSRK